MITCNQRATCEQFGETILLLRNSCCYNIVCAIFKFVVGDGELLESSKGKSCNESHSKEAESGRG